MAKKKHHQEHPDERWLLTYADMITLLMALFMVLYAMSQVSKTKFEQLKITLHNTFSSAVFDGGSAVLERGSLKSSQTLPNSELPGQDAPTIGDDPTRPSDTPGQQSDAGRDRQDRAHRTALAEHADQQQDRELAQAVQQIKTAIRRTHLGAYAHVVQDRANGIVIIRLVSDRVLFDLGSWQLKDAGKPLLRSIAHSIEKLPNPITVDGYTDAIPLNTEFGNLGLSFNRAAAVLTYMQSQGFRVASPHDTYPIAHGQRDPWKPNGPRGAQPLNRRVEIHILRIHYGDKPGQTTPPPLGAPIPEQDLRIRPLG